MILRDGPVSPPALADSASRSIDTATTDRMEMKTMLMYRFAAAPPCDSSSPWPNRYELIHTAIRIPTIAVISMKIPSFLSTCPSSP